MHMHGANGFKFTCVFTGTSKGSRVTTNYEYVEADGLLPFMCILFMKTTKLIYLENLYVYVGGCYGW